jgi:hypothetical protein
MKMINRNRNGDKMVGKCEVYLKGREHEVQFFLSPLVPHQTKLIKRII